MRIFFIGWNNANKEHIDVALKLQDQGHEILYWVGLDKKSFGEDRAKFKNKIIFHDHFDAVRGVRPEEFSQISFTPPGEDFIRQFYETESILSNMKLFEKLSASTLEKKRIFYDYLEYWRGVIDKLKPDIIIFALWPHAGYDFVLYSLAKSFKIKTILFEYARIADRLLLINDFTVGSAALRWEIERNKGRELKIGNLSPDIQKYYLETRQTGAETYKLPPDLTALSRRHSGLNLLVKKLRMILKSIFDFSVFRKTRDYLLKPFKLNLKKEYLRLQQAADFNKKFIYVATHYQPECSTSPLGGAFVDQILMIKILAAAVPKDWLIYVKEHPYQWLPYGLSYFKFRYQGYYESIAKLKNVHLVPIETSTVELINRSQAVATVTGTAGWEAALRLKPALIFGQAWYRDCPGVFRVNSVDSCEKIISEIIAGQIELKDQAVINYLASLDKISFHGYFERLVEAQSNITEAEHTDNFFNALSEEIEAKN